MSDTHNLFSSERFTYGRPAKASVASNTSSTLTIFTDLTSPPLVPLVAKMRKRETAKQLLSPKPVNAQKKKKLSPLRSPMVKKRRTVKVPSKLEPAAKKPRAAIPVPALVDTDYERSWKMPRHSPLITPVVIETKNTPTQIDSDFASPMEQPKRRKLLKKRPAANRVESDPEPSDTELVQPAPNDIPRAPKQNRPPKPLQQSRSRLQMEVVISSRPRPHSPSKIKSNTSAQAASVIDLTVESDYQESPRQPTVMDLTAESDSSFQNDPSQKSHFFRDMPIWQAPRYRQLSSPTARPRQVTPIRKSGSRAYVPPSPSTDSDQLDIEFEMSNLCIPSDEPILELLPAEYLFPLLEECTQDRAFDFSSFISTFPLDPVVQDSSVAADTVAFQKIGEASYSEVFGIGSVVLKVVPLRDEFNFVPVSESDDESDTSPALSDVKDVLKEIIVTRAMGDICDGFVRLIRAYVVRGRYPELLLELWDEFEKSKGSDSVRPDTFGPSQHYAIIVLPNGGPDLEHYSFNNTIKTGWRKASSVFWQVCKALAHAEQLVSFEHRDLHWGQILVKNLPIASATVLQPKNKKVASGKFKMDDPSNGVRITLIDLGLARMDAGDGQGEECVHWTPLEPEVFMGEGDYQFDIYRKMRDHIDTSGSSWEEFRPSTNVMWLHYLVLKLIKSKGLKAPPAPRKPPQAPMFIFTERECYECLIEVEKYLRVCVKPTGTGRKKKQASVMGPSCAGELIAYAAKKGWVDERKDSYYALS